MSATAQRLPSGGKAPPDRSSPRPPEAHLPVAGASVRVGHRGSRHLVSGSGGSGRLLSGSEGSGRLLSGSGGSRHLLSSSGGSGRLLSASGWSGHLVSGSEGSGRLLSGSGWSGRLGLSGKRCIRAIHQRPAPGQRAHGHGRFRVHTHMADASWTPLMPTAVGTGCRSPPSANPSH